MQKALLKNIYGWILPLVVSIACLITYFILVRIENNSWNKKSISYQSNQAAEAFIVWGTYENNEDSSRWPPHSFIKDNMVWTPLARKDNWFTTELNLPSNSHLYYWIVQTRSLKGDTSNIWDSGGDREYYLEKIIPQHELHPGLFIFLALVLPLGIIYFRHRNKTPQNTSDQFSLPSYIPQLDVIRAFAVLLVIIHHWIPEKSFIHIFPNGQIGVDLFFVLSGFLISGILLQSKRKYDSGKTTAASVFKSFYIRRTLRIFPIYYLFLIVLWFIKEHNVRIDWPWYFSYTSNYLFYDREMFPGHVAHLWSLGVEEQFYLLWPWLIVFCSRKFLPYLMAIALAIGISTNYITHKDDWVMILTPACFDAFAIGAFLAFLINYRQDLIPLCQRLFWYSFLISLTLFISDIFQLHLLPARTIHSLLGIHIIYYCLFRNDLGLVNSIFKNKWLIRLGKISYGIYLYHLVIPELWVYIYDQCHKNGINFLFTDSLHSGYRDVWIFIQEFLLLLLIASLSWKLIEKPINRLKKSFTVKLAPIKRNLT